LQDATNEALKEMGLDWKDAKSVVENHSKHRHRINKYLDTLLANQPISDVEATDRCQKVAPQGGGLPELIVARSCLTNHSEAASL